MGRPGPQQAPSGEGRSVPTELSPVPPAGLLWGTGPGYCPLTVLPGHILAPTLSAHLQILPPFSFFNKLSVFFPLRTCSIWQQESTVGLAGTVV